jgi:hypothetical protein
MGSFAELRDAYRVMGSLRFTIFLGSLAAAIGAFAASGMWLMDKTGWPETYGSHCHGRGCWLNYFYHSPKLLIEARTAELLLFGWIWFFPAVTSLITGVVLTRRWLKRRKDRIRPLT